MFETSADLSRVSGHFAGQQWVALGLLFVALPAILALYALAARTPWLRKRARRRSSARAALSRVRATGAPDGETSTSADTSPVFAARSSASTVKPGTSRGWSVVLGDDGRLSTSKTIALLWTVVVAYCVLAVVLVATAKLGGATGSLPRDTIPPNFISPALKNLWPEYLVLLGGPFASAIAAKAIVSNKVASGTLQKSQNPGSASALDIISDDDGRLDLVDLQYSLFNLIVAIYVITQFVPHAGHGIPLVPTEFAWLTGASAALYTGNKTTLSNPASITAVTPQASSSPGSQVTVFGRNLAVGSDTAATQVLLAPAVVTGTPAERKAAASETRTIAPDMVTSDRIVFTLPPGTTAGAKALGIITNSGALVTAPAGVTLGVAPTESEVVGGGTASVGAFPS